MASGERGSLDTELAVFAKVVTKQTSSACNSAIGQLDFRILRTQLQDGPLDRAIAMLTIVMDHRVIQGIDALEIFRIQNVLRADASGSRCAEIGFEKSSFE